MSGAIARAVVNRPRFLLFDEPLGALDALTRLQLHGELARIVQFEKSTALFVTHDVHEAACFAKMIVAYAQVYVRPGCSKRSHRATIFLRPGSRLVSDYPKHSGRTPALLGAQLSEPD
jgi:ABC-type nitrate/sulfonate/bicarbonate transport system ATPase subunit